MYRSFVTSGYCPSVESIFGGLSRYVFVIYSLSFYISVETTITDNLSV